MMDRKHAGVKAADWHDWAVGDRVLTVDGYSGVVTAVEDGPHPGNEAYLVTLDGGMGGGWYRSADILGSAPVVTARRYSDVPFVCDDCGKPAHSSVSGGKQGHTMLCDECREKRGKAPRKMAADFDPARATDTCVFCRQPVMWDDDTEMYLGKTSWMWCPARDGMEPHEVEEFGRDGLDFEASKTAARADLPLAPVGTVVTAADDYPELQEILWERPDLLAAKPGNVGRVSLTASKNRPWLDKQPDPVGDTLKDPNQPWWWRKVVGPAVKRFNDALPPGYHVTDVERIPGPNWCRFRRDRHCYLPKDLDEKGTQEAGYQVWIPHDRGICTRETAAEQRACPVGEPGPDSGERPYFPDATIPWSQGGQRKTGAWTDVRDKASRIRRAGQVRVIAYTGQSITAEVKGDSNIYTTTITRVPGTKQTALWHCTCPWNTYAWARSGRWKPLEGRMCSHALALVYEAQAQEMFGGEITEQSATPIWRTHDPVEEPDRVPPAPWRLDVAASVRPEAIAFALQETIESLCAAEALLLASPGEDPSTLQRVAQALDAARVDADVVRAGGSLGDVVARLEVTARSVEPFAVKFRGRILQVLELANGVLTLDGGIAAMVAEVTYPTWDPIIGLASRHGSISTQAADGADADGVMVAFSPSREMCERLSNLALAAGLDAEVPEQIHLTLAYLGKTGDVDKEKFLAAIKSYAAQTAPMEGRIAGVGTFANGDSHVLWASADVPGIDEYRVGLLPILDAIGSPARNDHGYTPHITLAYSDSAITSFPDLSDISGSPLRFTTLVAAFGGEWYHFDLTGSSGETVAVEKVAAKGDGIDACKFCGSSDLWSNFFDRGGLGSDGSGSGDAWDTLCESCGKFQIRRNRKQGADVPRGTKVAADVVVRAPGAGSSSVATEEVTWPLETRAILHDEPEPALPVTYGADDDDWAGQTNDLDATERMTQGPGETVMHTGTIVPGDARLSWLMDGGQAAQQDSIDIAAAAKAHLAKTALKDFSPAEQEAIIGEGADEHLGSRNDDRLDIDGTFYAAMVGAPDLNDDDSLW